MTEEKINELEKNFQSGMEQIMPHIVGHKTAQNLIIDSFKGVIQALQQNKPITKEESLSAEKLLRKCIYDFLRPKFPSDERCEEVTSMYLVMKEERDAIIQAMQTYALQQNNWISVEDRLPTHNDLLPSNGDPRYKEPLILVWDFEANLPRIIHYVTFEKEYYSHWKIINLAPPNK